MESETKQNLYWNGIFKDWTKMPVDCYKSIFDQAKDRFSEVMEESQTITQRAMQALLVYITTLSSIAGITLSKNHGQQIYASRILLIVALIVGLVGIGMLITLLQSKPVYYKGSSPKETFNQSEFDNLENEEMQQNFYYDEIVRYQEKTEKLDGYNRSRIKRYNYVLSISMLLIGMTVYLVIQSFL